jgi:hypothetical protein
MTTITAPTNIIELDCKRYERVWTGCEYVLYELERRPAYFVAADARAPRLPRQLDLSGATRAPMS